MKQIVLAAVVTVGLAQAGVRGCLIHETEPPSPAAWPEPVVAFSLSDTAAADVITDPAILAWRQNVTGATGFSPNVTIHNYVSQIQADVKTVAYNGSNVYVRAGGVPSHAVGPFPDGNPSVPSDRNRTFRIPRSPQVQAGAKTATGLGAIGVMVNGVPIYNAADARSYQNQNVWRQNANVAEAAGFDGGPGHPSPIMGTSNPVQGAYHYHQRPTALLQQVDPGNSGQSHSALIGYAFDGFPIYGPYGYANGDGTGGMTRIASSYQMRNLTTRTTLPDGTVLQPSQYGPNVGGPYPLGYYLEDFQFVAGSGHLDEFNGRFTVTPEYPQGTYAYFATIAENGAAAYPYLVGPRYYGVVATDNLNNSVSVPGNVTYYVVPEPSISMLAGLAAAATLLRRRRHQSEQGPLAVARHLDVAAGGLHLGDLFLTTDHADAE